MSKPETPCHPDCGFTATMDRGSVPAKLREKASYLWHMRGCPAAELCYDFPKDAPKAEAPPKCDHARIDPSQPCDVCPPAPVSEPPIDWKRVLKFANEYEDDWTPGDLPNASRAILSLIAERDALKAQNATLTAERDKAREDLHQITLGSHARVCSQIACSSAIIRADSGSRNCASGHPPRWVDVAELDALTAELERLRAAADRVVKHRNKHYRDVRETVDALEAVLARSLRAAREAGKS